MTISNYPQDIALAIRQRWTQLEYPSSRLPDDSVLEDLVDTMYQASLLREETEEVQCRIALCNAEEFALHYEDGASSIYVIRFSEPAEFNPHQIRKLASAADYYRSLLGVEIGDNGVLQIWGILSSGTKWANRVDTFDGRVHELPNMLVLHAVGPGHIIASAGDTRLLESTGGKTLMEGFDPFRSKWLPTRFESVRTKLMDRINDGVDSIVAEDGSSVRTVLCDEFMRDLAQSVIRRTLRIVRSRGQGGMLIYLPQSLVEEQEIRRWLRFRVFLREDESTLRFWHLMVKTIRRAREVGHRQAKRKVAYSDFRRMRDTELAAYDEALIELAHFYADLMSVDGALVLGRDYRLIGFGAEILGDTHVETIHRAVDLEATRTRLERADSSGTRHRSSYRLVSGLKEAIVVVVSQDGDVRFVATHEERLVYWPYLP